MSKSRNEDSANDIWANSKNALNTPHEKTLLLQNMYLQLSIEFLRRDNTIVDSDKGTKRYEKIDSH